MIKFNEEFPFGDEVFLPFIPMSDAEFAEWVKFKSDNEVSIEEVDFTDVRGMDVIDTLIHNIQNAKPLESEFQKVLNDNFWNLLEG